MLEEQIILPFILLFPKSDFSFLPICGEVSKPLLYQTLPTARGCCYIRVVVAVVLTVFRIAGPPGGSLDTHFSTRTRIDLHKDTAKRVSTPFP